MSSDESSCDVFDETKLPFDPLEINLVHYENPELVTNKTVQTSSKKEKSTRSMESGDEVTDTMGIKCSDVLNLISPPREWEKDGKLFCQRISNKPATKMDVIKLGEKLDTYLEQYNAKEVGICPIKRELYAQCFNEIIRQVTLHCAERGYILIRIRDEMKMTIKAYQELYESIIANWIRKTLLREETKTDLEKKVEKLREENEALEAELAQTQELTIQLEVETANMREAEVKRQAEELNALKKANQALRSQLESIISPKRMS